jgi:chemotaxis protein histidine kinase CheA
MSEPVDLISIFLEEAYDLHQKLEHGLLELERNPHQIYFEPRTPLKALLV